MKILEVNTDQRKYPFVIGDNILEQLSQYLADVGITKSRKILIVTDHHVEALYLKRVREALSGYLIYHFVINAGEGSKTLEQANEIITFAIKKGLDRTSIVIALGGGVVGDLAGFVASVYMRGIDFVQCPTTILAHDSSIGGKVGVNHPLGKNLIGAFHQPKLVFFDTSLLSTLSRRELLSGLAEVIKHGLITDRAFTTWLYEHAEQLLELKLDYINHAIYEGVKIKANVVEQDEKELGLRAILNFGHTFGHVIETITNYKYSHGEGVSIGMIFAARVSVHLGLISEELLTQYIQLLTRFHLPTAIPKNLDTNEMLTIMLRDKKFKQQSVRMILPHQLGEVTINEGINQALLTQVMEEMKKLEG